MSTTLATATMSSLSEAHIRDLKRSGIPLELAMEVGLRSASESDVQRLLGRSSPVGAGIVFPYPDPAEKNQYLKIISKKGASFDFVRVRLDNPERAPDKDGKPSKYLSRSGSGQQPYIIMPVAEVIKGGVNEIFVTEGEKKALSGWAHGFPTIGLPGNWGWKVKDQQELLPLLSKFLPPEHTVTLVFDSDAALNVGFAVSTHMLHDILRRRKCTVKVIVLPQSHAQKVGLDDFLVAHGTAAFKEIANLTVPLATDCPVAISTLLLSWMKSLAPALKALGTADAIDLLRNTFRKGLIDRVDHATRLTVLDFLKQQTAIDVKQVFLASVQEYLNENYGVAPSGAVPASVKAGFLATLPDEAATRVKILSVEDGFACATKANARKGGNSFPVPLTALKDISEQAVNDSNSPAVLADEFLELRLKKEGEIILRCHRNQFYHWLNGTYHEMPDNDLNPQVMGFLREKSPTLALPKIQTAVVANLKAAGVCHIPSTIETPCWISGETFAAATSVISFTNCNLNVGALRLDAEDDQVRTPLTPRLFTTCGRPYAFDENAQCPRLQALLDEMLPDPELQGLLQEVFGLCQIPDATYHRFFLFYGPGANAKGVVSDVLAATVGDQNVCSVSLARFGERFSLWPLTTNLVNLVAEIPIVDQGLRIAEDKLKAIVSGDFIEVERKNKDIVKARSIARLIFSCNELPPIADRSNGIWRRIVVVPFEVVIPTERQNNNLAKEIIKAELPGIFNWALEGLLRLQDRGYFTEPKACQALKDDHRRACAPEIEFIEEHVSSGTSGDFLVIGDVYQAYRNHITGNGQFPISIKRFVAALTRMFPSCVKESRSVPGRVKQRGYGSIVFHSKGVPDGESK